MFLSDLVAHMPGHVSLDFMAVSSYAKGTTSSGEVRLLKDLDTPLDGRNVIIVEDIVDTGLTLTYLQDILRARGPQVAAHRLPAEQAVAAQGGRQGRLHRLHDRGPVRRRLRPRLRGAVPQPAVHRRPRQLNPRRSASSLDRLATVRPPARVASAMHRRAFERQHLPIAHQHLAVHDRRSHVVAARDVDQVRHRIVHRRLPRPRASTTVIRSARLPASSDPISRVHARARARRRSSPCPAPSAPAPRVGSLRRELGEERRLAHRLEHVEVVVAGGAVGAEAERDAGRQVLRRPARCRSPASCCFRGCARRRRRAASASRCRRRSPRRRAPPASAGPRSRSTRDSRPASPCTARARSCTSSSVSARWISIGTPYLPASSRDAISVAVSMRVQRVRRHRRHDQAVVLELLDEALRRAPARRPASSRRRPGTE